MNTSKSAIFSNLLITKVANFDVQNKPERAKESRGKLYIALVILRFFSTSPPGPDG